jgi:hypothetical protein
MEDLRHEIQMNNIGFEVLTINPKYLGEYIKPEAAK